MISALLFSHVDEEGGSKGTGRRHAVLQEGALRREPTALRAELCVPLILTYMMFGETCSRGLTPLEHPWGFVCLQGSWCG